jgi:hypothetical protein
MDRVVYQPLIVQDLINWNKHAEIDLSPWYQRRSVWTTPQKSYLINTLFEQKPIPTLYFRHTVDLEKDKSIRETVDGQQRIRAILEYLDDQFTALHPEQGKKVAYSKLSDAQKRALRETQLSGGWLLGASDADVIEVFGRINSVSKTLNAQEKRNSEFSGECKQFCLRQAAQRVNLWRVLKVFSANDIARMQEVEFVSDLVFNFLKGLSDFKGKSLDAMYSKYDEDFPESQQLTKRLEACFSKIASLPATSITDTIFSRSPIFFSLIVAMDSTNTKIPTKKLDEVIQEIDDRYNSDKPMSERPKVDAEFYDACRASTQRISTRRVRDKYIKRFLK